ATSSRPALGFGRTFGHPSSSSFSNSRASSCLAYSLLLDCADSIAMGSVGRRQTGKAAYSIPRSNARLPLWGYLVSGKLLLDLPDDVSLRWPRKTHCCWNPLSLLPLPGFVSSALRRTGSDLPIAIWPPGCFDAQPICLGSRGTRSCSHHRVPV